MNKVTALVVMRIGLGINMLMHGLVRLPKLQAFSEKMAAGFQQTVLPEAMVKSFLLLLPFLELITGLLILIGGRWARWGLITGSFILFSLLFGTTLKEDWNAAGTQLIYVVAFAFTLFLYDKDNANKLTGNQ